MNAPSSMHEMKIMTQLPDMGTGPIPVEPYISPEYFKKEKEKIFKKAWINVGRVDAHIPNPGDYMVRDLAVFNASILLVHGRDGVVRGVGLAASSGQPALDQAATDAARRAGRCPAAPAGLNDASYSFELPISLSVR